MPTPDQPLESLPQSAGGELPYMRKIRAVPWLIIGGVVSTVFCVLTVFGPILPLFLEKLGLSNTRIGAALFMIPVSGVLAIFISAQVARFGPKRMCILAFAARKLVLLLFLFTPWIAARFGAGSVFVCVLAIFLVFGLMRAAAETAIYPWIQEIVPNEIRGKLSAGGGITASLAAIVSLWACRFIVMRETADIQGLMAVFGVGMVFGFLYVATLLPLPGGAPQSKTTAAGAPDVKAALRDPNFRAYLLSYCLVIIGLGYGSFLPLFLTQTMRLSTAEVFVVFVWGNVGVLASSFLWGWCADRFGSKPVMATGLLLCIVQLCAWLLFMPSAGKAAFIVACVLAVTGNIAFQAYNVGMMRYLFVNAVPASKRYAYMPVFYAVSSIFGGIAPLIAGRALDLLHFAGFQLGPARVEPFSVLVAAGVLCLIASLKLAVGLSDEEAVPTADFLGMFFEGNPFLAFHSMFRFRSAWQEKSRIFHTERLGLAKSRISAKEIIEAMQDPSFNVRYEAVVAAARMPRDRKITAALMRIVIEKEPDLSIAACWALGRIGDPHALPAVRAAFRSEFALLRARAARSLAALGDTENLPAIREAFRSEPNDSLRVAYASALGSFRDRGALPDILELLRRMPRREMRAELSFAVARIAGDEGEYTKLWRAARSEFSMAAAHALQQLLEAAAGPVAGVSRAFRDAAAEALRAVEAGRMRDAVRALASCIQAAPLEGDDGAAAAVLRECAGALSEESVGRQEYFLLALHFLWLLLESRQNSLCHQARSEQAPSPDRLPHAAPS